MKLKYKIRLLTIVSILLGVAIAAGLVLYALKKNINLYLTPTQTTSGEAPRKSAFRMGGMVKKGSFKHGVGLHVSFVLTDFKTNVKVIYKGVIPTLFREGQGVIVEGQLRKDGTFVATEVLAKHDEKYMPPNITKPKEAI